MTALQKFLKQIVLKQVEGSVYLVPAICDFQIDEALEEERRQWQTLPIDSVSISLLKKYMAHVMDNESVSFVENANDGWSTVKFTDDEIKTLKCIHKEIINEY